MTPFVMVSYLQNYNNEKMERKRNEKYLDSKKNGEDIDPK